MSDFLKIVNCVPKPKSHNEMIYTDDKGEVFFGPAKDVTKDKTYEVEVTTKPQDGRYEIIKFVSDNSPRRSG